MHSSFAVCTPVIGARSQKLKRLVVLISGVCMSHLEELPLSVLVLITMCDDDS